MTDTSVIGCGTMGSALIRGLAASGNHRVVGYDIDEDALAAVAADCEETTTDLSVAAAADVVVVAVKPSVVGAVIDELDLSADQTLVTIAAGVSRAYVAARTDATVVRLMPNLAAEYGMMAGAVAPPDIDDGVRALLEDVGVVVGIDEAEMDIATAVNGSGPAFVFYLLDAMKQAGIEGGLGETEAERLAAQTFKGAAETVLRSGQSVEDLIEAVCSPKGTTIEGMEVLWDSDVDEVVAAAVHAAEARSRELAGGIDDE
jgi:pyrroline-5-carboxylate reductase